MEQANEMRVANFQPCYGHSVQQSGLCDLGFGRESIHFFEKANKLLRPLWVQIINSHFADITNCADGKDLVESLHA
uniref:Uncharacterized protein n=1 Tax=Bionectria ochroleuca TaxID=29856 RepID=A0A0B7JN17_BIOOC